MRGTSPLTRYGVALFFVVLALLLRLTLDPAWGTKYPLLTFYPAIMVAAWLGGFWPGAVATILSAVAAEYYWFAPVFSFSVEQWGDRIALILFVGIGLLISRLNEALHRARRRLEERSVVLEKEVAERKQLEMERDVLLQQEQAARAEAETANRAKDEFLAMLSHELRSPLNAMLGWVSMLRSGRLSPDSESRGLEVVERNTRTLARMIDDLLDQSRIMAGKLSLDLRPVDLISVIEGAIDSVGQDLEAKRLRLSKQFDPSVGPVWGDRDRLQLEQPSPVPSRGETLPPRRVLIVEDNDDAREMLRLMLGFAGHEVYVASDGAGGVQTALAERPDVALIDIGLPRLDGYEVARQIRSAPEGKEMTLVALTGYGQLEDQRRVVEAGFDAHLVKPVDPDRLAAVIAGSKTHPGLR